MNPFAPIHFLDTWALSSSLRMKLNLFGDEPHAVFVAREGDGRYTKALREWRQLAIIIDRIRKLPMAAGHEFGEIAVHQLRPSATTPWLPGQSEWRRVHLAVVTNPLAFTFCGIAAQALPIGVLTLVDATAPSCVVNWGEHPCYHLTAAFRQKEPEISGEDEALGETVAL